jgi:hypothetical protein
MATRRSTVEILARDAKLLQIGGGTDEIRISTSPATCSASAREI